MHSFVLIIYRFIKIKKPTKQCFITFSLLSDIILSLSIAVNLVPTNESLKVLTYINTNVLTNIVLKILNITGYCFFNYFAHGT